MLEVLSQAPHMLLDALAYTVWDVDPIAFEAGPLQFRWYGLLFALGLMQGYFILRWQYARAGEDPDRAIGLVYAAIAGIIIGSRLGHVIFYEPTRYFADPIEIIKFWKGGLASHGATIGLIVTVAIYSWYVRKIPMRIIADRFALMLPLATSCVRLGNFFNSEIVGRVTDVSWAVIFPRHDLLPRHPSQLYEVTIGIVLFLVIYSVDRAFVKKGRERPLGLLISVFLVGYFSMRFGVEYFKEYQAEGETMNSTGLTMGQYLSIPFALLGVAGIWASLKGPWKDQTESQYLVTDAGAVGATAAAPARKASSKTLAEVDEILAGGSDDKASPTTTSGAEKTSEPAPSRTARSSPAAKSRKRS